MRYSCSARRTLTNLDFIENEMGGSGSGGGGGGLERVGGDEVVGDGVGGGRCGSGVSKGGSVPTLLAYPLLSVLT